jgi:hypothetical protein
MNQGVLHRYKTLAPMISRRGERGQYGPVIKGPLTSSTVFEDDFVDLPALGVRRPGNGI